MSNLRYDIALRCLNCCLNVAVDNPDKKIASVKHKSVNKRFKETRFAAGANRQYMAAIEEIGISFDEFIDISLEAMREIADEIGL